MTVRAYSCSPGGDEYHLVVFADTGRRARYLAFLSDPGESEFIDWRCRRFPCADGLYASEVAWVDASDAPAWHQSEAKSFWCEP